MNEEEFEESPVEPDPLDDLDPQVRQDIDQVLRQGFLSEAFTFGGHSFIIKTLTPAEANAAALAMKPYQGSLREVEAYMQATCGLAIASYDGDSEFHIKLDDLHTHALKRFQWVTTSWDDVLVHYVYGRYNQLDQRLIAARAAIVNLPEEDRASSTPSPGFLTEQGTSPAEQILESLY